MSARQRILIVGASARAAAWSARRAGWDVAASDLFGDTDLRATAVFHDVKDYPGDFLTVAARHGGPVMYTGGLENRPALLAAMNRSAPIWGAIGEALALVRDPFRWTRLLRNQGFLVADVAETRTAGSEGWLAKPFNGAGGDRIRLAATSEKGQSFLQKRVAGEPISAVFIGGPESAEFCGATRQLVGIADLNAAPFAYCGSVWPIFLTDIEVDELCRMGDTLARGGLRGLFGVDLIRNTGGLYPVEINPRYTASVEVIERATGICLLPRHREVWSPSRQSAEVATGESAASVVKQIFFARHRFAAPDLISHGSEARTRLIQRAAHIAERYTGGRFQFERGFPADIPRPGAIIQRRAPICSVLLEGRMAEQ